MVIYLRVGIHVVLSDLVAVHVGGLKEVVAAPDHPNQVRLDIQKCTPLNSLSVYGDSFILNAFNHSSQSKRL